jgi:hypothetical protein
MNSQAPFRFVSLSQLSFSPTPISPSYTPSLPPSLPPLIISGLSVAPAPAAEPAIDYEMKWSDLDEGDIRRFRLEEQGRCYASYPSYDVVLKVYRDVYLSYPEDVRRGITPVPEDHHSGIFYRDVLGAKNEANHMENRSYIRQSQVGRVN